MEQNEIEKFPSGEFNHAELGKPSDFALHSLERFRNPDGHLNLFRMFYPEHTMELLSGDETAQADEVRGELLEAVQKNPSTRAFECLQISIRGMNDEDSWAFRDKMIGMPAFFEWDAGTYSNRRLFPIVYAAESTIGIADAKAMKLRIEAMKQADSDEGEEHANSATNSSQTRRQFQLRDAAVAVLFSLLGQDSDEAWDLREAIVKKLDEVGYPEGWRLVLSHTGALNSKNAKELRRKYLEADRVMFHEFKDSLVGLDDEESWGIREEIVRRAEASNVSAYRPDEDYGQETLLETLAGVDSDRAWKLRKDALEEVRENQERHNRLAVSLANSLIAVKDFARAESMLQELNGLYTGEKSRSYYAWRPELPIEVRHGGAKKIAIEMARRG